MRVIKWILPLSLLIVAGVAQAGPFCAEGQAYTTSKGATFKCVKQGKFGEAWQAPDGIVWSMVISGTFKNTGFEENGLIVDSEATRACSQVGGLLPTNAQLMKFQTYFEYEDQEGDQKLTRLGRRELYNLFPDMIIRPALSCFWSSSLYIDAAYQTKGYAWSFIGIDGLVNNIDRRLDCFVRCVSR